MQRLLVVALVFSVGCGTLLNSGSPTVYPPPGGTIDGSAYPIPVSKRTSHEVVYPDGRRCIISPRVSGLYLIGDIFLFFLVGVIVDAVTGDWYVLDAGSCPGVMVQ